jgi:hypothetical protein
MKRLVCLLMILATWSLVLWSPDVPACTLECPAGDGGLTSDFPGTRTVDFSGDGSVTLPDFAEFAASYLGVFDACADLNCDGVMTLPDLGIFAFHWLDAGAFPTSCIL